MTERRATGRIGVGVVGTGFAALAHLEALRTIPEVEIVAVAGSDPQRTAEQAARYGARAHSGHLALLDDPAVDAVHTCTVNQLHHAVNLAALERGKHVLSEKPLAADSEQSAELVAAARRAAREGAVSGVCFNYRHYPMVAQIRELVRRGEYGAPHLIHGAYLQDWLLRDTDWNWRLEEAQGGGPRAIADIGSHWIDLAQHVTGDAIVEVLADVATLHPTRMRPPEHCPTFATGAALGAEPVAIDSEDFGTVLLRFRSGARGAFTVSQASAGAKNGLRLQIDAAEAAIAWNQESPERAWVGRRGAPNLELVRDPETMDPAAAALSRLPAGHPEGWRDALRNLFVDFYASAAAVRDGREHESRVATFAEGHLGVQLVEAVMESAQEQRWIRVAAASTMHA